MIEDDRLRVSLANWPRIRITLSEIRKLWIELRPDMMQSPLRDRVLLDVLRQLHEAGVVKIPSEASFERVGIPRMPKFVNILREAMPGPVRVWNEVPWLPELGFWPTLNERDRAFAEKINRWLLMSSASSAIVPLRERALEIFGDEKALDARVRNKALFGGRLPVSVLKAILVPHPLPYRRADARGAPLLVVENHHTYWSFSEWNEHAKVYAAVVYGSGQAFCSSGDALVLAQAESGATGAEYFGDLDPKGIAIPLQFMEATGICLEPALRFYQAALRSGLTNKGVNRMPHDIEALRRWLPSLAESIRVIWDAGFRVPQESIGTQYLSTSE